MRIVISHFIRRLAEIVLVATIAESAAKMLRDYLSRYFREELLEEYEFTGKNDKGTKGKKRGVELEPLLVSAIREEKGSAEHKQKILEDLVHNFTKPGKSSEGYFGKAVEGIRDELVARAYKDHILLDDADRIISRKHKGKAWDADDVENFETLRGDFIKLISKGLSQFFRSEFGMYVRKKKDPLAPGQKADIPEAEAETAEFIKEFSGERGKGVEALGFSIEELEDTIEKDNNIKPKLKKLYMALIDDNILKKKGDEGYKTLEELAEEHGYSGKQAIIKQKNNLKKYVRNLMVQRGKKSSVFFPYQIIKRG